jgi:hypothetical protein
MTEGSAAKDAPRTSSDEELDPELRDPGVLAGGTRTCRRCGGRCTGSGSCTRASGSASWLAWPPDRRLPAHTVATDRTACTGGRPALRAWLGTVDLRRRDRIRPGRSGGKAASNQADTGSPATRCTARRHEPDATRHFRTTERRRRGSGQAEQPPAFGGAGRPRTCDRAIMSCFITVHGMLAYVIVAGQVWGRVQLILSCRGE